MYTYHLTHSTGLSNADMLGVFPWYSPVNGDELLYLFDQPGVALTEEEEVGTVLTKLRFHTPTCPACCEPVYWLLGQLCRHRGTQQVPAGILETILLGVQGTNTNPDHFPPYQNYLDVSATSTEKQDLYPERMLLWERMVWDPLVREAEERIRARDTATIWSL